MPTHAGASAAVNEPVDEFQRARTRARQRLIGAALLLAIGIIGFPLIFETQPRPIPVDIPIEIPRKEGAPPLAARPAQIPAPIGSGSTLESSSGATMPPPAADGVVTEEREEANRDAQTSAASHAAEPAGSKNTVRADPTKPGAKPEAGDDGARARALLEGKTPVTAEAARFIVQVGAFADANAAQDTRMKIERLGLKTYTQVANTPAGSRTRVRVGPFASRDEADKALAKARSAGLSAVLLSL